MRLHTVRRGKFWWIHGDDEPMGPYTTKREALETVRSLNFCDKHKDEPGFVTSESKGNKGNKGDRALRVSKRMPQ
jgi:hypothetical protein